MRIIKPLGLEVSVTTTPNSIGDAKLVRIFAAAQTKVDIAGAVATSFTMGAGEFTLVEKEPAAVISCASGTLLCTAVAYRD